jgi:hypothetical protein
MMFLLWRDKAGSVAKGMGDVKKRSAREQLSPYSFGKIRLDTYMSSSTDILKLVVYLRTKC